MSFDITDYYNAIETNYQKTIIPEFRNNRRGALPEQEKIITLWMAALGLTDPVNGVRIDCRSPISNIQIKRCATYFQAVRQFD